MHDLCFHKSGSNKSDDIDNDDDDENSLESNKQISKKRMCEYIDVLVYSVIFKVENYL